MLPCALSWRDFLQDITVDGIGPKDRPVRLDLAWHTIEPNEIGDEL